MFWVGHGWLERIELGGQCEDREEDAGDPHDEREGEVVVQRSEFGIDWRIGEAVRKRFWLGVLFISLGQYRSSCMDKCIPTGLSAETVSTSCRLLLLGRRVRMMPRPTHIRDHLASGGDTSDGD